jgi:hypothetical protein
MFSQKYLIAKNFFETPDLTKVYNICVKFSSFWQKINELGPQKERNFRSAV